MTPRENPITPDLSLYKYNPIENYLSSASLERPTGLRSALNQFSKGVTIPGALGADIYTAFTGNKTAEFESWQNSLNVINNELQKNSGGFTGFVANVAGQTLGGLPFISAALGETVLAGAIGKVGGKIASKIAAKEVPLLTLSGIQNQTLGKLGGNYLRYGLGFAGFSTPEAIEESYDEKTNSFNLTKASIQIAANGALGALIPTGQFLIGLLGKRVGRSLVKEIAELPKGGGTGRDTGAGSSGPDVSSLPKPYQDFVAEYIKDPESTKTHKMASQLVKAEGYQVDSVHHKAVIKLLTEENHTNLFKVTTDPLFADLPEAQKTALKDYVIHGRLDELKTNKDLADGIMGWIEHIDEKLTKKGEVLAAAEKDMFTGVKEHMEFSQSRMVKDMKKAALEDSHVSHFPYTVPANVEEHVKVLRQLAKLKAKVKKFGENAQTLRRMKELEGKLPKLLTPKEELEEILSKSDAKGFKNTRDYQRLTELAHYWPQARKLLDRIHLADAHNAQAAYRDVLESFAKIIKGNLAPLANPERVTSYLRTRMEQTVGEIKPMARDINPKAEMKESVDLAEAAEADQATVDRTNEDSLKNEYSTVRRKTLQFQKNESALKALVDCVLGERNGQI